MTPGHIDDITFKNIAVTGNVPGEYTIELVGADENHTVNDVKLLGISILGNKIKPGAKNLKIGSYTSKINIK
ncbi:MAG: hypothetical protein PHI48_03845 [Bacteroidales bacterium]|nr:hypothetical protein [Bacteroidales bacterium]